MGRLEGKQITIQYIGCIANPKGLNHSELTSCQICYGAVDVVRNLIQEGAIVSIYHPAAKDPITRNLISDYMSDNGFNELMPALTFCDEFYGADIFIGHSVYRFDGVWADVIDDLNGLNDPDGRDLVTPWFDRACMEDA